MNPKHVLLGDEEAQSSRENKALHQISPATASVCLRDAIVALGELGPFDHEARVQLSQLFRFELRPDEIRATPPPPARAPVRPPPLTPKTAKPHEQPEVPRAAPKPTQVKAPEQAPVAATLTRTNLSNAPVERLVAPGELLSRADEASEPAAPEPIFGALEARNIFGAALSSWVEEGALDVPRVVAALAAGRPLRTIARLPVRTLRHGVQLLLDRSSSMAPYAADVRMLEAELGNLLGQALIERLYFWSCPSRGVRDGQRTGRRAWRAPARGVPLLIASDFGLGGDPFDTTRARVSEWHRFATSVRADGHRCIGLVPFARSRWPTELSEVITFVHWSEHTVASSVDFALREVGRRHR